MFRYIRNISVLSFIFALYYIILSKQQSVETNLGIFKMFVEFELLLFINKEKKNNAESRYFKIFLHVLLKNLSKISNLHKISSHKS